MHPDRVAKAAGWLIIATGEAYMKDYHYTQWWQKEQKEKKEVYTQKSRHAALFIFREGRAWVLWRGSFRSNQSEPISERVLGKSSDIRSMISRGENFISWWENKKRQPMKAASQKR
jgi:hypothetical protein